MDQEKLTSKRSVAAFQLCWLLRCNPDAPMHVLHHLSESEVPYQRLCWLFRRVPLGPGCMLWYGMYVGYELEVESDILQVELANILPD